MERINVHAACQHASMPCLRTFLPPTCTHSPVPRRVSLWRTCSLARLYRVPRCTPCTNARTSLGEHHLGIPEHLKRYSPNLNVLVAVCAGEAELSRMQESQVKCAQMLRLLCVSCAAAAGACMLHAACCLGGPMLPRCGSWWLCLAWCLCIKGLTTCSTPPDFWEHAASAAHRLRHCASASPSMCDQMCVHTLLPGVDDGPLRVRLSPCSSEFPGHTPRIGYRRVLTVSPACMQATRVHGHASTDALRCRRVASPCRRHAQGRGRVHSLTWCAHSLSACACRWGYVSVSL
jgi:hypothetical protein